MPASCEDVDLYKAQCIRKIGIVLLKNLLWVVGGKNIDRHPVVLLKNAFRSFSF